MVRPDPSDGVRLPQPRRPRPGRRVLPQGGPFLGRHLSEDGVSSTGPVARHPRSEAEERLGGDYGARVLEPSPPAIDEEPWFADDPVNSRFRPRWCRRCQTGISLGGACRHQLPAGAGPPTGRWYPRRFQLCPMGSSRRGTHCTKWRSTSSPRCVRLPTARSGCGSPWGVRDALLRRRPAVEGRRAVPRRPAWHGGNRRAAHHHRRRPPPSGCRGELSIEGPPRWDDSRGLGCRAGARGFLCLVVRNRHQGARGPPDSETPNSSHRGCRSGPSTSTPPWRSGRRKRAAAFGGSPGDEDHPEPYVYVSPWSPPRPTTTGTTGRSVGPVSVMPTWSDCPTWHCSSSSERGVSLLGQGQL